MKMENLTGAEKVLYKASYDFAINIRHLTDDEAKAAAEEKIMKVRKLGRTMSKTFKY